MMLRFLNGPIRNPDGHVQGYLTSTCTLLQTVKIRSLRTHKTFTRDHVFCSCVHAHPHQSSPNTTITTQPPRPVAVPPYQTSLYRAFPSSRSSSPSSSSSPIFLPFPKRLYDETIFCFWSFGVYKKSEIYDKRHHMRHEIRIHARRDETR
jgi:hypothetical protein